MYFHNDAWTTSDHKNKCNITDILYEHVRSTFKTVYRFPKDIGFLNILHDSIISKSIEDFWKSLNCHVTLEGKYTMNMDLITKNIFHEIIIIMLFEFIICVLSN